MRRVVKTRPPSNVAPANQGSFSLLEAEIRLRASLPTAANGPVHARTVFDSLDKRELRAILYADQHQLCVYCERRINEGDAGSHPIEHWRPVRRSPELALHWKNLYLSCAFVGTCDNSKADTRLVWREEHDDLPWPTEKPYEEWIGFTSGGEAYVRIDAPLDDAKRKALQLAIADQEDEGRKRASILNLNHPALVEARQAAIEGERIRLNRDFRGRSATDEEKKSRARAMLEESVFREFISVRVAYLNRVLGKNREPTRG